MTARRNLVIGAVRTYEYEKIRPFVASLKRSGFDGELVLLWNTMSDASLGALRAQGVTLAHFEYRGGGLNSWSRFWPQLRPIMRLPVGDGIRHGIYKTILNLAFVRYLHALDFLKANRGTYQYVFLTDVRDVIFQADPFRDPLPGEMVAFLEEDHMKYGDEPLNDGWVAENYGIEKLEQLKGERISCCGTIMGSEAGMIRYLEAFIAEIPRLRSVAHGADTSVHNVLLREVLGNNIEVVDNISGPVVTVNSEAARFQVNRSIVDREGRPVPVLHQYDRVPQLEDHLLATFAPERIKS